MSTITKIPFDPANHADFVAIRDRLHSEHRLGGSDIGIAAGLSKYKSRRRFYEEMVGHLSIPDISNKQAIKDGILCEDLVAKKFEERTGKKVHRVNAIQLSDTAPHLYASIDRKVENEDAGLECKTANAMNYDAFKGGKIPDTYVKQIKTYMKVTGYRTWYCHVWVMGVAELTYLFTMDEVEQPEWCDRMVDVTQEDLDACEAIASDWFDNHIIPGVSPEEDGSEDEADVLSELFPESTDMEPIALANTIEDDIRMMEDAKEDIKRLEEAIAKRENIIKDEMGSHAEAVIGSRRITWRNNKPSSKTDWKLVAAEMHAPDSVISTYTTVKPGARILRIGKAK